MATISLTELINKKIEAIGVSELSATIERARAYFENKQYPKYGNWPLDDRGAQVYPKVIAPLPSIIVRKSSRFLMKKLPRFYVNGDDAATDFIWNTLERNQVDFKTCSETAGIEGGIWFKFIYDGTDRRWPWKINVLSVEHVIPIYNPHDYNDLQAARILYQYIDNDGKSWWHREDWTDSEYVLYMDLPSSSFEEPDATGPVKRGDIEDDDGTGPWIVRERQANAFGVIPLWLVKNVTDPLNPHGAGDYWHIFDLFDRINVAYDNMDRSNQFGGGPVAVFIEADDAPTELAPHGSYSITGPNASVSWLEQKGDIRPHMEWYADKLESFAYAHSGIVNPKLEDVAGLGQLSYAALQLLHGPLIESTDVKRDYWGKWGLARFFERMLDAANAMSKTGWIRPSDKGYYRSEYPVNVTTEWPDHFPLGGVDKQIELGNIRLASELGMPIEDAARWLAKVVGIAHSEIPEFLKRAQADAEAKQQLQEAMATIKQMGGGVGGNNQPGLQNQAVDGGTKGAARKQE